MIFNKHKHKGKNWITYGIIKSIKTRDKKFLKLKKTSIQSPEHETLKQNLATYNNILKRQIREAKMMYYEYIFQKYKGDIKKTWGVISEILNKKRGKSNPIKEIRINNKMYTNTQDICDKFNNFFVNIGPRLANEIETPHNKKSSDYLKKVITCKFHFELIDENETFKIIKSLKSKNSAGHDGLSFKTLKVIGPLLLKPLTLIINQSLITGIFPYQLKIAKVIPLCKKADNLVMDNYRPVSLLTSISKVFEKVAHKQLSKYFETNRLFYESQYGFRESHSTELASIELIDRILSSLEQKK